MSRPRKRYVPKRVANDPVLVAITRAIALTPERRAQLFDPIRAAFEAARRGQLTKAGWRDLADAVNVGEQLARRGIASDRVGDFLAAMKVLADLIERAEERGTWTMYPAEISALELVVEIHRIQLEHCSQGELMESIAAVRRWVTEAKRGNYTPGARVAGAAV